MSPSRKRLLRFLAASAGLGAFALGGAAWHYTRPSVQRALALDALRGAGWTGDISAVSAGLGGAVSAEGVDLTDAAGRRFRVNRISGDIGLLAALTGDIHIGKLSVDGLVVDLAGAKAPAEKPAVAPAKTPGKFPRIRVDAADIAGRVSLAGGRSLGLELRVRNADTRSGGTAVFTVADSAGPVVTGEARAKFSGEPVPGPDPLAVWRSLDPAVSLDAEARPAAGAPVAATLALEADAAGAKLAVRAGTGRIELKVAPGDAGKINFTGDILIDRTAFAAWTRNPLPEFSAKGRFACAFDPATLAVDATVTASGDSAEPPTGAGGPRGFSLATSFSGSPEGPWRIRNLHAEIGAKGAAKPVVAEASALTVWPGDNWRVETAAGEAASVKLAGAKLAWLNPLVAPTGWSFASGDATGTLRLTRDAAGKLSADSGAGLAVTDLAVLRDGRPYLDKLALTLPVGATRAPDGALAAAGTKVVVARAGATVLEADFAWNSGATGAGVLTVATKISPGALPGDFLPGGACSFCKDTGLELATTARVSRSGSGATTVESAKVEAVTRDGVRALAATLARPLDPENIPADGAPVASLAFRGAPLSLFNTLLRGPVLGGVAETGDLTVSKTASGWKVARPAEGAPAFVRGLSWTDAAGTVRLAPTDARGTVAWEQTPDGWKLALDKTGFTNAGGVALSGDLAFVWSGGGLAKVDADLRGDAPALATSLPDARKANLSSGAFTLQAHHGGEGESTLDLNLTNLRPAGSGAPLGAVVRLRTSAEKGVRKFSSPIVLSGPSGVTKLALDGTLAGDAAGNLWNASVTGDTLFADDWKALFASPAGGKATAPSEKAPRPGNPKPDTASFWAGNSGKFAVALDAVKVAGETVTKPRLALVATPARFAAESFSGELRGIPAGGSGEIAFKAGEPKPYALAAKGGVTALPLGKILATVAPNAAGWVDGDFDLRFSAAGSGENLGMLFSNTTCAVDAESRDGTLRFFKVDNEAVRLSGEIAGMAGDLAGDLGKILGKKSPAAGRILSGGSVIQKALSVVNYKKFALSLKRLPDGSLEMPAAELSNAALRLHASGRLGPALGAAFLDRNASVAARLDGRDVIAEALRGLGRAADKPGADGWLEGPELRYEGPLNNIRNNLLNNLFRAVSIPSLPVPDAVKAPAGGAIRSIGDAMGIFGR